MGSVWSYRSGPGPAVVTVDVGGDQTGQEIDHQEDAEPHQPARPGVRVPHLALAGLGAVTEPSSQTALSVGPEGEREGQTGPVLVLTVRRTGSPGVSQEVRTAGLTSPV